MKLKTILWSFVTLLTLTAIVRASEDPDNTSIWQRETLTNGFFGLNDELADNGIEVGFSLINVYQQNLQGGTSTHRRAGRFAGSYDLEISADMQKLLGFERGRLYLHAEGSWSKSQGIDTTSVGSAFGVNDDAGPRRSIDITELWYERPMFDGTVLLRIGKIDLTGGFECHGCPVAFDISAFANDENTQFLNSAFVNNPTIPFPDYALGVALLYNPVPWWYVSAGAVDAQNDSRETGFRTAFHKEDYFFYIVETGVISELDSTNGPLPGTYRVGSWYDPQPKANSDSSKNYRDDTGLYLSCDQLLTKENNDPQDNQGLGTFFRYGYAHSKTNDITNFWSLGLQYQGLLDGRDDDVMGLGFAQGVFSDQASTTYTEDYETAMELYYSAAVTPWLNISPSIQYIKNPGGSKSAGDAVVIGARALMAF